MNNIQYLRNQQNNLKKKNLLSFLSNRKKFFLEFIFFKIDYSIKSLNSNTQKLFYYGCKTQ